MPEQIFTNSSQQTEPIQGHKPVVGGGVASTVSSSDATKLLNGEFKTRTTKPLDNNNAPAGGETEQVRVIVDTSVDDGKTRTAASSMENGTAAAAEDHDDVVEYENASDALKYAMTLRDNADLVEQADMVLGPCSDEKCSYSEGYSKRQALYSCLTCCPETHGEPAGVCLACSLRCHDGHTLVELYCKRLFRCDCGNSKFTGFSCKIEPRKETTNEKNKYNDNFWGKYCLCKRPYPDPDVPEEELEKDDSEHCMHQCMMCEDWYHLKCFAEKCRRSNEQKVVSAAMIQQLLQQQQQIRDDERWSKEFEDEEGNQMQMMCGDCRQKHAFLNLYIGAFHQNAKAGALDTDADVVENDDSWWRDNISRPTMLQRLSTTTDTTVTPDVAVTEASADKSDTSTNAAAIAAVPISSCYLTRLKSVLPTHAAPTDIVSMPIFFDEDWVRQHLCTCTACMQMYDAEDVAYLLDADDSYSSYCAKAVECKRKREEDLQQMSEADNIAEFTKYLSRRVNGGVDKPVDPVVQTYVARGISEFRSSFQEFVIAQAEQNKTISVEDVKEFTENLRKKLRGDMKNTMPPHDCSR